MRSISLLTFAALLAAGPAVGQVIYQDHDAMWHQRHGNRLEQRADHNRAEAWREHQQAQRLEQLGHYRAARRMEREARRDWHQAQRQDERAQRQEWSAWRQSRYNGYDYNGYNGYYR